MQQPQLKILIEDGSYRPQPELVAQAMLRRRGVRALLTGTPLVGPGGRMHPASTAGRQAA